MVWYGLYWFITPLSLSAHLLTWENLTSWLIPLCHMLDEGGICALLFRNLSPYVSGLLNGASQLLWSLKSISLGPTSGGKQLLQIIAVTIHSLGGSCLPILPICPPHQYTAQNMFYMSCLYEPCQQICLLLLLIDLIAIVQATISMWPTLPQLYTWLHQWCGFMSVHTFWMKEKRATKATTLYYSNNTHLTILLPSRHMLCWSSLFQSLYNSYRLPLSWGLCHYN